MEIENLLLLIIGAKALGKASTVRPDATIQPSRQCATKLLASAEHAMTCAADYEVARSAKSMADIHVPEHREKALCRVEALAKRVQEHLDKTVELMICELALDEASDEISENS